MLEIMVEKIMDKNFAVFGLIFGSLLAAILVGYVFLATQGMSSTIDNSANFLTELNSKNSSSVAAAIAPPVSKEPAKISFISIVDSDFGKYADLSSLKAQVKKDANATSDKTIEMNSIEGKQLIEKYSIKKIPTLIIEGDTKNVALLQQGWPQIGSFEDGNVLVLRNVPPIYFDIELGKRRGEASLLYLADNVHSDVYDVKQHKLIIERFGLQPVSENEIDYNSSLGQKLIAEYNISRIPTIILSGDVNAYDALSTVWKQIGTIEADGNRVFRNMKALGDVNFFDLIENKIIDANSLADDSVK